MYRILIIEDDRAIAETMQRQIALWGYEVRCVENFKDVLSEFTAFDPLSVFCLRQYEHCDGDEHGWRRLYRQTI